MRSFCATVYLKKKIIRKHKPLTYTVHICKKLEKHYHRMLKTKM